MGSSWKLVAVFAVLFLTGGVSGSLITYSVVRKQAMRNPTRTVHTWTENLMQKLEKRRPAHTRAKRENPAPGGSRGEADEIDSNSSDATGQRRSRRRSGRDRNWIESGPTKAAGTFSRTPPSVSSGSNLQKRGAIATRRLVPRSGTLKKGKDRTEGYHATPANSSACTLNCRSYSFR